MYLYTHIHILISIYLYTIIIYKNLITYKFYVQEMHKNFKTFDRSFKKF